MTDITGTIAAAPRGQRTASLGSPPAAVLVVVATAVTLAVAWPSLKATLAGGFADPDDAMRLVEVRGWLAVQSWFDVSAPRLDPPTGASMHWSRIVDLPNAALIRLFGLVTTRAEALDAAVLPTLWLLLLYAGMARLGRVLLGRSAQPAVVLGTLFCGATLSQFAPGRIGHHAPETVTLVFAVAEALRAFAPGRARHAAAAGALVALGVAMSLETLPFLGGLAAAMVALWVARGAGFAPALRWFGAGLGLTMPLFFAMDVPPPRWFAPVCDAFGMAHLAAGMLGAAGCGVLAAATPVLGSVSRRLAAAAVLAAVVAGAVAIFFPACLHSPFAAVDPLVRQVWLDNVVEAKPLPVFFRDRPNLGLALALPSALGIAAGFWAAARAEGPAREGFAVLAILAALGLGLGFWQVRVLASTAPLAMACGLFAVASLRARLAGAGLPILARFAPLAILPFTVTGWALALPADPTPAAAKAACLAPAALAPLAGLPPGRIVAPIDVGSHLLEATPHAVFAAPYHRNDDGNRFALDVFLAPPAEARALLGARHVAYLATCGGMGETARLAARAPQGLAARLLAGGTPDFLRPLPLSGTPYTVYAVAPGG